MKKLFSIGPQYHGQKKVVFAWQPQGGILASVGDGQRSIHLFDRRGMQIDEIQLRSTNTVLHMEWDKDGEVLAILQSNL